MSDDPSNSRDSTTFKVVPAAATIAAAPTKRASAGLAKSAPVKPPTTIHPSAIVAEKAVLSGSHPITIAANTVIHPFARIVSNAGPVTIAENVIVNERAVVGISGDRDGAAENESGNREVHVGAGVTIESSAVVEAHVVEEGSVIDVQASVGLGARIGRVSTLLLFDANLSTS